MCYFNFNIVKKVRDFTHIVPNVFLKFKLGCILFVIVITGVISITASICNDISLWNKMMLDIIYYLYMKYYYQIWNKYYNLLKSDHVIYSINSTSNGFIGRVKNYCKHSALLHVFIEKCKLKSVFTSLY